MENIINENKRRKLDRPITGNISEDRIWEQWYDADVFEQSFPEMLQKDYLFQCIGQDKDRIIIDNRGMKKFTVSDFEKMVLEFEKSFSALGLQKGDVICTISLTTPEMYAIKYSATSLGLITCNLNVLDMGINDDGKNRLYRQLENVNPKMIFTLDYLEDKIYSVINDSKFSHAIKVSLPMEYSTPIYNPERFFITLKLVKDFLSGKKINEKMKLNDFLLLGKKIDTKNLNEIYEKKLPCNISFTSGTTGINKAILLSHDANNALAFQQKLGKFGFKHDTKNLALVPPFLAFWDADIVHAVLCLGGVNIIELLLEYSKIPDYFKKHNVNMGIWSQYLWSSILNLPEKDLKRVSENLKHAIIGGERCELNAAETFYNKTGVYQMTGFGSSEVNTTFSITHPYCNKIGTAGIPLPFNNVKILDENGDNLSYGQPGRLFITGPCMMNGYYGRDDLTNKVLIPDKNGVIWYDTGDYAVVDYDGCLTVLDRYKSPIEIQRNGQKEKVNMLDIVEIIKKDRNVKNCKMTNHSDLLVLHLSLDNFTGLSTVDATDSILNTIKSNLPEKYWPNIIAISSELPRTPVGKVEYKVLQQTGNDICKDYDASDKLVIINLPNKVLKKSK